LKNIKHTSALEKATEVTKGLLNHYQQPEAKDLLYNLLKRGCLHTEHPVRAQQCAKILVPELQALSETLKKRGQYRNRFWRLINLHVTYQWFT